MHDAIHEGVSDAAKRIAGWADLAVGVIWVFILIPACNFSGCSGLGPWLYGTAAGMVALVCGAMLLASAYGVRVCLVAGLLSFGVGAWILSDVFRSKPAEAWVLAALMTPAFLQLPLAACLRGGRRSVRSSAP